MKLDELSASQAIDLMLSEEATVALRVRREKRQLARLLGVTVRAFRQGGRLFYVGAGTSGRLGVLDASECPPTFGTSPSMVQGIIAGGNRALRESVEGAEDDAEAGAGALKTKRLSKKDIVIGIAASGATPFVWGALQFARRRGATTVLLCFNPTLEIPVRIRPDIVIAPNLGPEVLTGSTRLKAGTGTKLILNLLTTLAMARLGKVKSNLMVGLNPANQKLRQRAVRIVRELTGKSEPQARSALSRCRWVIARAICE